jgi:signal transduction histidine kinase/PAS domain-containing protein
MGVETAGTQGSAAGASAPRGSGASWWLRIDPRIVVYVFAAILILAAWGATLWKVQAEQEQELARLRKEAGDFARVFEEQVVRSLQAIDQTMLFLKSEYEKNGAALDFSRYVREGRILQGIAHLLMVIDERGDVVFATSPMQALDVSRHEYEYVGNHAAERNKELVIGRPVFGSVSKQWRLPLSRRLEHADGSYAGVVVASFDPGYFSSFYGQVDIGRQGVVALVGLDGIMRARQTGDVVAVGQDVSSSETFRKAREARNGIYDTASKVDQVRRIHAFRQLRDYPLIGVVGISTVEGLAEAHARAVSYWWGAGIFSLFTLIFSFGVATSVRGLQITHMRLRKSQSMLAEAQRLAGLGNWSLDPRSMTAMGSTEVMRITGFADATSAIPMAALMQKLRPEHRDTAQTLIEKALQGRGGSAEVAFHGLDGRLKWVQVTAEGFEIAPGVQGARGTLLDITERKRREAHAERERQVLQEIASGAQRELIFSDLCWHVEAQCSGALCSILLVDDSAHILIPGAAPSLPQDLMVALDGIEIRAGNGACGEAAATSHRVVIEDIASDPRMAAYREIADRFGLAACTSTPIIAGTGEVLGTFAVYWKERHGPSSEETRAIQQAAYLAGICLEREASEREIHKLNEELEARVAARTSELQAVNRELEAFSYSVSHDLRAPLRAIDGFASILAQGQAETLDEASRKLLDRIVNAAQRMGRLIDDMLAVAMLTRSPLHFQTVDLSATANAIADELTHSEPERRVKFIVQDGLADVADPNLIRVVLENLIGNAWKFTRKQSEALIEFGVLQTERERAYFVRDNGVGFDMVYADKLFGPFQRLHRPEDFPGSGIGLATVQRLVHRHRGRVWAESRPGQGATFYFTLDANAETNSLPRAVNE